jgi:hypothetical protein
MDVVATLGLLLPIAVAGAFSSVPLALATVVLLSKRPRANGVAYLIGLTVGTFAVTLALAAGLGRLQLPAERMHNPIVAAIEVVIGAFLIGRGILIGVRPPVRRAVPKPPGRVGRFFAAVGRAPLWTVLGTGFMLSLRIKALVLGVAAGVAVSNADLPASGALVAVAVYTLLTVSTVAGPVVFTVVDPVRATAWLTGARARLAAHRHVLSVVVSVLVGAVIAGNGLTHL